MDKKNKKYTFKNSNAINDEINNKSCLEKEEILHERNISIIFKNKNDNNFQNKKISNKDCINIIEKEGFKNNLTQSISRSISITDKSVKYPIRQKSIMSFNTENEESLSVNQSYFFSTFNDYSIWLKPNDEINDDKEICNTDDNDNLLLRSLEEEVQRSLKFLDEDDLNDAKLVQNNSIVSDNNRNNGNNGDDDTLEINCFDYSSLNKTFTANSFNMNLNWKKILKTNKNNKFFNKEKNERISMTNKMINESKSKEKIKTNKMNIQSTNYYSNCLLEKNLFTESHSCNYNFCSDSSGFLDYKSNQTSNDFTNKLPQLNNFSKLDKRQMHNNYFNNNNNYFETSNELSHNANYVTDNSKMYMKYGNNTIHVDKGPYSLYKKFETNNTTVNINNQTPSKISLKNTNGNDEFCNTDSKQQLLIPSKMIVPKLTENLDEKNKFNSIKNNGIKLDISNNKENKLDPLKNKKNYEKSRNDLYAKEKNNVEFIKNNMNHNFQNSFYSHKNSNFFPLSMANTFNSQIINSKKNCYDLLNHEEKNIIDNLYEYCIDSFKCRKVQEKLDQNKSFCHAFFDKIKDQFHKIICDPFGNYVFQKFLENCSDLKYISEIFLNIKDYLYDISINSYGTRGLQKLLEYLNSENDVLIINDFLKTCLIDLIFHKTGNHVIQQCLIYIPKNKNNFIYDKVCQNIVLLSKSKSGGCVISKMIQFANKSQLIQICTSINKNLKELINDEFGNFLVQQIYKLNITEVNLAISNYIEENFIYLSKQKFSSNVIDKCVLISRFTDIKFINNLGLMLIKDLNVINLIIDKYGNYIVKTLLTKVNKVSFIELIKIIKLKLKRIKNSPYGDKIYTSLIGKYKEILLEEVDINDYYEKNFPVINDKILNDITHITDYSLYTSNNEK